MFLFYATWPWPWGDYRLLHPKFCYPSSWEAMIFLRIQGHERYNSKFSLPPLGISSAFQSRKLHAQALTSQASALLCPGQVILGDSCLYPPLVPDLPRSGNTVLNN